MLASSVSLAVACAPWLLPRGAASLDHVRSPIEADTIAPEQLHDSLRKERRRTVRRPCWTTHHHFGLSCRPHE
jgi:hypothetical protein